jgi:hypothetical protein
MLFATVATFCFATVPLLGGHLVLLAEQRFRAGFVAVAGLLAQVLIISVAPGGSHAAHVVVHLGSYGLIGYVLWANRRLPFLWVIAAGGALNFAAIAANGGVMPATRGALRTAGSLPPPGHFINSTIVEHPHLQFLGDVFAIRAPWAHNVFSVGDVVIALGTFLCIHTLCESRAALGRPRGLVSDSAASAPSSTA